MLTSLIPPSFFLSRPTALARCSHVRGVQDYHGARTWICVIVLDVSSIFVTSSSDVMTSAVLPILQVPPTRQLLDLSGEKKSV